MNEPTDSAVADARTTSLDPPIFEDFFHAERARLFRALLLVTGDRWQAEEILQDSFCRIWQRWDEVARMKDPSGYLFRTAMNGHRSAYRRAMRAARHVVAPAVSPDPFDEIAARDEAVRALARLTSRQRAAVVVTELLGYPSADAARILGIRAGTVRTLVSQARAALTLKEVGDG